MGEEPSRVRSNWRAIPVVALTDAEVAEMSDTETRWCWDLLMERHRTKTAPPTEMVVVEPIVATPIDLPLGSTAVLSTGDRIRIWHNESDHADCFTGELLNPTERETHDQGHISTMWSRAKVVSVEPNPLDNDGLGG